MAGREVREYTNLSDPKDKKWGKGKDKMDDEDITYQRMVAKFAQPAFHSMLENLGIEIVEDFKIRFEEALLRDNRFEVVAQECTEFSMSKFNEACKDIEQACFDISKVSKVREKLRRDIDPHINSVHTTKILELKLLYEYKLNNALSKPVEALLDIANDETWPAIRRLLQRETETIASSFLSALSSFDIDQTTIEKSLAKLEEYTRSVVEFKARKQAETVLMRMKNRWFSTFFFNNFDSMPRTWTKKEDITKIIKLARLESIKLLSTIAVIRLEGDNDSVERTLQLALVEVPNKLNLLASNTWEDVPLTRTLIKPIQCKSLWTQFKTETEFNVRRAIAAQEANKMMNNNRMLSPLANCPLVGIIGVVIGAAAMLIINYMF